MLERLIDLASRLGDWGYLVVFLGATLEASAFLGLIVPGESLVVLAGFLASRGIFEVNDLIPLVAAGAVLGDSIGYELGRRLGRPWLIRHGHRVGLRPAHLERVDAFFAGHGGKTVLLGRFVGVLRALAPFVAGSSHMQYRQFLPYNVLGGILWSIVFVLLGYFAGASWRIAERWIGRASAIVGGVVLLILASGWLWRWLAGHEAEVRERWGRVVEHPWVLALHRRFGPQLAFIRARLSPQAYLGLHLTVGALILTGATWVFGAIAQGVVRGAPLTLVDVRVSEWLHARASPHLTVAMRAVSSLGSPVLANVFALGVGLLLLLRRRHYWLLALAVTVPGGLVLNLLLKVAFQRQRPQFDEPLLAFTGYSFPSSHAIAATLVYGMLAAFAVWTLEAWRWRVLAVLCAALLIVLIGFSRIYLGAHYLSDVLAAIAEGLAWLALCLTAVDTLRRRRRGLHLAVVGPQAKP